MLPPTFLGFRGGGISHTGLPAPGLHGGGEGGPTADPPETWFWLWPAPALPCDTQELINLEEKSGVSCNTLDPLLGGSESGVGGWGALSIWVLEGHLGCGDPEPVGWDLGLEAGGLGLEGSSTEAAFPEAKGSRTPGRLPRVPWSDYPGAVHTQLPKVVRPGEGALPPTGPPGGKAGVGTEEPGKSPLSTPRSGLSQLPSSSFSLGPSYREFSVIQR